MTTMKTIFNQTTLIMSVLLLVVANVAADGYSVVHSFGILTNGTGFHPQGPLVQGPDGTLYGATDGLDEPVHGTIFKINSDGTGFTVLKWFTNAVEGSYPRGKLVLSGGTLYGATSGGGNSLAGTVFKINTDGSGFSVIKHFAGYPDAGGPNELTLSGNTLYGTTEGGGSSAEGTVFKVNTDGSGYAVLRQFTGYPDGRLPRGGLTLSGDTLYGTTYFGGNVICCQGYGTIFKITTNGTGYAVLKNFTASDGLAPRSGLVLSGSTLYGTTELGGGGYGTVFKINLDGSGYTLLMTFSGSDGSSPGADLILSGSTLFGTASGGGGANGGTVFMVNTNGTGFTNLHEFNGRDGRGPGQGVVMSGTTLYGTTAVGGSNSELGTVFKINTDGSGFTSLFNFAYDDGATPRAGLVLAGNTLYGTTQSAGNLGDGTLFKVNTDGTAHSVLKYFSQLYVPSSNIFTNSDGFGPQSALIISGNTLYGTAWTGGSGYNGTAFKLNTDASGFAVLRNFAGNPDGASLSASLVLSGEAVYGTTYEGGDSGNGTIFKVNTNGSGYVLLKSFSALVLDPSVGETNSDGAHPQSSLVASGGTLYGTTRYGGSAGGGTVFKLNTNGSGYSVLRHFTSADGVDPNGGLALSGNTLYGTTQYGDTNFGAVFKINTNGSGFTKVHSFSGYDGAMPYGTLLLSGSTLYGTTASGGAWDKGTVFKVNTDGTGFTSLHHFSSTPANAGLVLSGSTLFGTVAEGGDWGRGIVFALHTNSLTVNIAADYTNVATGFTVNFTGSIVGQASVNYWDFGDGTVVSNQPAAISHSWSSPGNYAVVLRAYNDSFSTGVTATVTVHVVEQPVHYVAVSSTSPVSPYTSWATAATNIQDAVDAASVVGALVLVSNGVYQTGMRELNGETNRLVVVKLLTVQSVNGPALTEINGAGEMPCVALADGATLKGFTLTNGVVGASGGTLIKCMLVGNVYFGAINSTLNNCTVKGNAGDYGAYGSKLTNCTLTGNSGVGAYDSTLNNCIVYYNSGGNYDASVLNYCCTTPFPAGIGNITTAPLFVNQAAGNLRLQSNSPCINSGLNAYVVGTTDLDDRPRIVGGTVDLGAYEFQPGASGEFIGWLSGYSLPTDGAADYLDADGDLMNNWQEWRAGTVPTNAASVLRLLTPIKSVSGITLRWQSVTNRSYYLQRATNLTANPAFLTLATNLAGQVDTTSYLDTNTQAGGPFFYRVGVQ